jgi:hypothetical protein
MRHPEPDNIKNMESQPPANLNFWIRELPKTVPKKLPKKNYNHSIEFETLIMLYSDSA